MDINNIKDKTLTESSDPHSAYLLKRWHKIATALFTVSSHIKDSDQIKWNIRNRTVDIMSFMYEIVDVRNGHKHTHIAECIKEIEILISEFALAANTGLIGRMNYSIVSEEITKFVKEVTDFRDKDAVLSPLQKEFMHVDKPPVSSTQTPTLIGDSTLGNNLPNNLGNKSSIGQSKGNDKGHDKGHKDSAKQNVVKDGSQDRARQERRIIILDLLKKRGNLSIKDFTMAIKGCSVKTIQRELISLVEEGVLYKTGDRRWSTYSLISK